jgi:serine/threonine protein kinase
LGEGGFGEVYKAYDAVRHRWIAIKISKVKPNMESLRLKKEVELVKNLPEHPNIAYYENCYTFREMSGEYDFGILQYYEEGNLLHLLKKGALTPEQKVSILKQILAGVEFLHSHDIIHRDLKPQNILMVKQRDNYIPVITDFGISKKLDVNYGSVFSNSLVGVGTLAYASPEQLAERTIRKNADLWSFGVIAFQLLTGQLPFTTGAHAATSEAGRLELFRQINSGVLPDAANRIAEPWQQLICACLATDSDRRVRSAQACLEMLNGVQPPEETPTLVELIPPLDELMPPLIPPKISHITPSHIVIKKGDTLVLSVRLWKDPNATIVWWWEKNGIRIDRGDSMLASGLPGEVLNRYEKKNVQKSDAGTYTFVAAGPRNYGISSTPITVEVKSPDRKHFLWKIAGCIAGLLLFFYVIGTLSTPGQEDLAAFEQYKQMALKNFDNARMEGGDAEFYNVALDYCDKALAIRKDDELKKMKKEIETRNK